MHGLEIGKVQERVREREEADRLRWMRAQNMPAELVRGRLLLSQEEVRTNRPVPLLGRPDQVFVADSGLLVAVDTKNRRWPQVFVADIVQLQRTPDAGRREDADISGRSRSHRPHLLGSTQSHWTGIPEFGPPWRIAASRRRGAGRPHAAYRTEGWALTTGLKDGQAGDGRQRPARPQRGAGADEAAFQLGAF